MSQEFKFKLKMDEMKENSPAKQEENYHYGSNVRNVCFIQADGKMLFLNYSYLVSCEYLPNDSSLILNFTSHTIALGGTNLEPLYHEFFNHIPKIISQIDERYKEVEETNDGFVTEMKIEQK